MTKMQDASRFYNRVARYAQRRETSLGRFEPVQDALPGIVFSIGGSIYVDGRGDSYVYVHEFGIQASHMFAFRPAHIIVWEGAGVWLKKSPRPPYEYEIIGIHVSPRPKTVISETQISRTGVSVHGENHQWPTEGTVGNDPVMIWSPALQILKSVPSETDLNVTVGPLAYLRGSTREWFATETVDLTSYLPATDKVKCVLLYLNPTTGVIGVAEGPTANDPYGTYIPEKPATPSGGIASGYFYLRGGATTLNVVNDYLDGRIWLGIGTGSVSQNALAHAEEELDFVISDHIVNHPSDVWRGKLEQASHTDTTWYTVLTIPIATDTTMAMDVLVSGHSDDAATASWAYQFNGYGRNDGGTVTSGFGTVVNIVEYDANYDAQLTLSGTNLLIQVRRNGGTSYDVEWSALVQAAFYD